MSNIESPCIDVCKLNPETTLCEGCWRTREEIKAWKGANTNYRLKILSNIEGRKGAVGQ
ncbi:MAG: DUF1289 domain-containing protein [Magnetovibrio sp.]|nr:DUF1289 domain-containing protein [Magnetovibrio sp.]